MKKTVKLISILLVLALTFTLTGCTSDELSFLQAMEKLAKVKSYTATSELSTKIISNIPAEINNDGYSPINLKSVLNSLKNFKLTSNVAVSKDKDKVLGQVEYGVSSEDISFKANAFVKIDGDKLTETLKIPTVYRWLLPADKMDAEYLTLDFSKFSDFMKEQSTGPSFGFNGSKVSGQSDRLVDAYIKFQNEYAKKMPAAPSIIKKSGSTYKLSFTDASFKLFLRAIVDTYFKEADAKKAVEDFGNEIVAFYDEIYPGMLTSEIKDSIGQFSNNIGGTEAQVDMIFAMLDKFPILGEKGININYSVDSKGYINKVDGFIDLFIDVNAISTLTGEKSYDEPFNFDILLNFKTEYKNINEPVKVSFPTLTEKNSISYVDILKNMKKASEDRMKKFNDARVNSSYESRYVAPKLPAEDGSISVVCYGNIIDFGDYKPEIINGSLYAPLDVLSDELYLDYNWDLENDAAVFYNCGIQYWMKLGEPTINNNDFTITLPRNILDHNGKVYVPLKSFVQSVYGAKVTWNEEENAAHIGYDYGG